LYDFEQYFSISVVCIDDAEVGASPFQKKKNISYQMCDYNQQPKNGGSDSEPQLVGST
jgi:hypothetical protein